MLKFITKFYFRNFELFLSRFLLKELSVFVERAAKIGVFF